MADLLFDQQRAIRILSLVSDLVSLAAELVRLHGGSIRQIYRHAIKGFSVQGISDGLPSP
ncbi:MAG: hypothetical protein WAU45_16780 [Blastocatellia bacterium]